MRSYNVLAATVSLSLSLATLAGCGQAPTSTPPQAAQAAQTLASGSSDNGVETQRAQDMGTPSAAPVAAMPSMAPVATPSAAPVATVPGGGAGSGPMVGGPGGVVAPVVGAVPGVQTPCNTCGGGIAPPVGPGIGGGIVAAGSGIGRFQFASGDLVAFQSDRRTGGGDGARHNFDIFVYDALAQTVLALPAVNTPANETNPRLSSNGQWVVYQTDETGHDTIRLFDLRTQLINTLRTLNAPDFDNKEADISSDGNLIVYVSNEPGGGTVHGDSLRVFDLRNGQNYIVPVANRGLSRITWPTISGNGAVIAYSAFTPGSNRHTYRNSYDKMHDWCTEDRQQVFIYSLLDAAQLTPPFINDSQANNYNPSLSADGEHILFVSDRRGQEDIYEVDLRSGFTDNLVLANQQNADQQEPRYLGLSNDRFVFQSDRTDGLFRLYAFDRRNGLLDTLPVANEVLTNSQLRNTIPNAVGGH